MSSAATPQMADRAMGALLGLGLGDAMGMPSQTLTRLEITRHYGEITGFQAPFNGHPVSAGMLAAQITDDTEQALILAEQLIGAEGKFDENLWARNLVNWEAGVKARGLHDLLGPSTKQALETLLAGGSSKTSGKDGTTNGAAMRIAPIGISTPMTSMDALVARVEETCRVTHNTGEAIGAASAVAAVVSAGVSGLTFSQSLPLAISAARLGSTCGYAKGITGLADCIEAALELAAKRPDLAGFGDATGTSVASHHSVPAAFGLVVLAEGDPWRAAQLAANIGDDTDTIGAIACCMAGACSGAGKLPRDKIAILCRANKLDMTPIATGLLELRVRASSSNEMAEGAR